MMTACVICGQRIELVMGPRICESCALYPRKVEDAERYDSTCVTSKKRPSSSKT